MAAKRQIKRSEGIGERGIPGTLARLLTLTSDAVFVFDATGRILLANSAAGYLCGTTSAALLNTDIGSLFYSSDYEPSNDGEWPFPTDGRSVGVNCRLADGTFVPVGARCDSISAPGTSYMIVARSLDGERAAELERERLVEELSQANHRLSGTLKIVLGTLDSQDMGTLFSRVLEELCDTMEASGTIVYLAEGGGFRLRGATSSLDGMHVPQFLPLGKGVATIATREGHAMRLRIAPPDKEAMRSGTLLTREVFDEATMARHRVPARYLPPFANFICVPVWFGEQVIAIIEVGWENVHASQRDDARLLDAVAQYLSVELASAFTAMRNKRIAHLDTVVGEMADYLRSTSQIGPDELVSVMHRVCEELEATGSIVRVNQYQRAVIADLPVSGSTQLPCDLDEVEQNYMEDGVAVVPLTAGCELSNWLAGLREPSLGALVDLGVISGARRIVMVLRDAYDEPLEASELTFLHRVADEVRDAVAGAEARTQDTRISQALQSGMKNELQTVTGITARGLYSSATAAAFVGGDFYDLVRLPGRKACVVLGDVSGKGVEAASVSSAVKTAVAAYSWEGLPPAHMVQSLNDFLMGFSRLETFATMFVGIVDLAAGKLTYCSAGHPPALLLRAATGELETLDVRSGVVGAFHEMSFKDGTTKLSPGDVLLLYTDGVTEARDPKGAFFGEEGLRETLLRESRQDFDGLLERMLETIDEFTERHLDDDVAMVALRFDELGRRESRSQKKAASPHLAKGVKKTKRMAKAPKSPTSTKSSRNKARAAESTVPRDPREGE